MKKLIPLQFVPLLKERVWGGSRLRSFAKQDGIKEDMPIGELWGLYDRPEASAAVRDGDFQGCTLHELLLKYGEDLVGKNFTGTLFPVFVKLLDARQRLSLQVHPSQVERKDECWYIMKADPGAKLFAGIKRGSKPADFWNNLHNSKQMERLLLERSTKAHDFFFIKSGCVHALDSGNMVMEIQENSDTTYRISDWGRLDANGKSRELHLDQAKKVIDFSLSFGNASAKRSSDKMNLLRDQTSFSLCKLRLKNEQKKMIRDKRSFHILSSVDGDFELEYQDRHFTVKYGDLILVPAACGCYRIRPVGKKADILLTQRSSKG